MNSASATGVAPTPHPTIARHMMSVVKECANADPTPKRPVTKVKKSMDGRRPKRSEERPERSAPNIMPMKNDVDSRFV